MTSKRSKGGAAKRMMVPLPGCSALDENLKGCGFVSVGCFIYHGDSEIYSWGESEPRTVIVWFCKKHSGDAKRFEEVD